MITLVDIKALQCVRIHEARAAIYGCARREILARAARLFDRDAACVEAAATARLRNSLELGKCIQLQRIMRGLDGDHRKRMSDEILTSKRAGGGHMASSERCHSESRRHATPQRPTESLVCVCACASKGRMFVGGVA